MDAGTAIAWTGYAALGIGLAVEAVGIAAYVWYPVRRRLYRYRPPIDSPITFHSAGIWMCFAALGAICFGDWLRG